MNGSKRSPLERLIRALGRGDYSEVSAAYRACYAIGGPLVPQIVEKICAVDWKDLGPHGRVAYFTCLMRLLHDIDEPASRELADTILSRGCNPVLAAKLHSIQAFTLSDFDAQVVGSLPVFVAKTVSRRSDVWPYLAQWLGNITPGSLEGIHRLYVVEEGQLTGAWGTYLTELAVISLVWRPSHAWNRLAVLLTELTLYHEIGHHLDRRGSEVRESQEAFADTYGERIFRKAHPWVGKRWVRLFLMPWHTRRKLRRIEAINRDLSQ